jgi:hypothetical protein
MNARALTVIAFAAAVLGLHAPPPALASSDSYGVGACSTAPGFVNHAWLGVDNDPASVSQGILCPTLSGGSLLQQQEQGLFTVDNLSATSGAISGASAGYLFTAPEHTKITELSWDRFLGIHFEASWTVGLWVDGVIQPSDTCTADYGNGFECSVGDAYGDANAHQDLQGLEAHQLFVGVQCPTGGCTSGASIHRAWASIYDATVTLSDSTPPIIGPFSGSLTEGAQSGTQSLTFQVSDSTGIKELDVTLDGTALPGSPGEQSCDYTNPVPCPSLPKQTYMVNTSTLAAGEHTIEVKAIDAAGLVSTSTEAFTVPNPPSSPSTGTSTSPISNPGQDSQGGQGTGSVGGTPTNAELQITRAQVTGHCLVITARLPSSYTGLMTFTVTTRHSQRTIRLRRTVKMVGGVAHLIVALDANERSSDKLTLIVRYGGDRAHPAQTHRTTVPVPHARVHHTR